MMTRRGFFATLLAPVVARFTRKPVAARTPLSPDTMKALEVYYHPLTDNFFVESPLFFRLKNNTDQSFSGGDMISSPLTYAPATEPDMQVSQTIHNLQPDPDGWYGDGAN